MENECSKTPFRWRVYHFLHGHVKLWGPLAGCSCSTCFSHPWRLYYWREGVRDRVRIAHLENEMRDLRKRLANQERKEQGDQQ